MMLSRLSRLTPAIVILSTTLALSGCGYNDFQRLDEQTKSAWAEVLNQYQRRADLIPNLVETVKGETSFEQETLTRVIEARSRATAIQVRAAVAAVQYTHAKKGEGGKKEARQQAAEKIGGRFAPTAPPRTRMN